MYASDDNYAWLMGISMISLFENNKDSKGIDVYVFGDNLSEENQKTITAIAEKYGRTCHHVDVAKINIPQILMSDRYPKSTFSRLFAYELLPKEVEKLIPEGKGDSDLNAVNIDLNLFSTSSLE